MKKKFLSFVLSVCLLITCVFALTACGENPPPEKPHSHEYATEWTNDATHHWYECSCGEKDSYALHTFDDNTCSVCGYEKVILTPTISYDVESESYAVTGVSTDAEAYYIVIPSKYNDGTNGEYAVTSIKDNAFRRCTGLMGIEIPNTITSIGDGAFNDCTSLTNLVIPDSVTELGSWDGNVFGGCSSLESITIPFSQGHNIDGTGFCFGYFFGAPGIEHNNKYVPKSLKTVVLTSITEVENRNFYNCRSIETIVLPETVSVIREQAFYNCFSLSSIIIPKSVTSIEADVFLCADLTVLYCGTEADWNLIEINEENSGLYSATMCYYSEEEPTTSGNYWHYVDGVATVWGA